MQKVRAVQGEHEPELCQGTSLTGWRRSRRAGVASWKGKEGCEAGHSLCFICTSARSPEEKRGAMPGICRAPFPSNSRHSLLFLLGGEENIVCASGLCCPSVLTSLAAQELCLSFALPMATAGKLLGEQAKSVCGEEFRLQQEPV